MFTVFSATTTVYHCRLENFRASVPAANEDGTSDPYIRVNFDNFRSIKTPPIYQTLAPVWDTAVKFNYETEFKDCLAAKRLTLELFDANTLLHADEVLGYAEIDLHTLSVGPADCTLDIVSTPGVVGRVQFTCVMNEISLVNLYARTMKFAAVPEADVVGSCSFPTSTRCVLEYYLRSYPAGTRRTSPFLVDFTGGENVHNSFQMLYIGGGVADVMMDAAYIRLLDCDRGCREIAMTCVPLNIADSSFVAPEDEDKRGVYTLVDKVRMIAGDAYGDHVVGREVITLECQLVLNGLPRTAQMTSGKMVNGHVFGGVPLLVGMPPPRQWTREGGDHVGQEGVMVQPVSSEEEGDRL
eukprot:PhM_4_TR14783/c0_g1_i1/m.100145